MLHFVMLGSSAVQRVRVSSILISKFKINSYIECENWVMAISVFSFKIGSHCSLLMHVIILQKYTYFVDQFNFND